MLDVFCFRISLDSCTLELDLTIVDRICALLNPEPVCVINKAANLWNPPAMTALGSPPESRLDFKVTSPLLTVKLR